MPWARVRGRMAASATRGKHRLIHIILQQRAPGVLDAENDRPINPLHVSTRTHRTDPAQHGCTTSQRKINPHYLTEGWGTWAGQAAMADMQDSDNIQVLVRVRPPNAREQADGFHRALDKASDGNTVLVKASKGNATPYAFDHVVDHTDSQQTLFDSVGKPIAESCLQGYHGCLLAYGQTGAGKTFTMQVRAEQLTPPAPDPVAALASPLCRSMARVDATDGRTDDARGAGPHDGHGREPQRLGGAGRAAGSHPARPEPPVRAHRAAHGGSGRGRRLRHVPRAVRGPARAAARVLERHSSSSFRLPRRAAARLRVLACTKQHPHTNLLRGSVAAMAESSGSCGVGDARGGWATAGARTWRFTTRV